MLENSEDFEDKTPRLTLLDPLPDGFMLHEGLWREDVMSLLSATRKQAPRLFARKDGSIELRYTPIHVLYRPTWRPVGGGMLQLSQSSETDWLRSAESFKTRQPASHQEVETSVKAGAHALPILELFEDGTMTVHTHYRVLYIAILSKSKGFNAVVVLSKGAGPG